jgi:hypothetical protein
MGTCPVPLLDQLYNFDRWLTWNREGAEDLVHETYAKASKGFGSFRLGTNSRRGCICMSKLSLPTTSTATHSTGGAQP